uniref:Alpha-soluble NSF attachment protein n=1 Tax=Lygus hesperus TaxID=30085 RepID=A0A0A9XWR9_LYGHE
MTKSALCSLVRADILAYAFKYTQASAVLESLLMQRLMDQEQVAIMLRCILCILLDRITVSSTHAVTCVHDFERKVESFTVLWNHSAVNSVVEKLLCIVSNSNQSFSLDSYGSLMQEFDRVINLKNWFVQMLLRLRDTLQILSSNLL